jgi:hypothetical protein
MAIFERIVTVYNDKGSKQAIKDLNKLEKQFKDAGKKIAKAFGVATLAAAGLAIKLGKDGVEAAIADQKSQALLANALRNTTGANEAAIASVEEFITTQQRLVSVSDDELRPSLATLLNATKDVTQAQSLQNLALDISAGTQRDLQSVSLALAKAVGGNFSALTRLGVPLSDDIKKSKDLNGALNELGKTFAGAASTRAETFEGRMQGIRIAFSEALETLGFAFLPVLEKLVVVFQTQVIPAFEKFIAQNKDELAQALGDIIEFLIKATKGLASMFKTISDNLTTFKIFTALIVGTFVGTKVAAGIGAIIAALKLLTGVFKKQAVAGTAAGTATAFATGGTSAFAAAAGIVAFTAAVGGTLLVINKMTAGLDDNTEAMQKNSGVVQGHLADLGRLSQATAAANIKNKGLSSSLNTLIKKTKEQIATDKALAALRKLGVKPTTEKDPIQLEAARLNLIKQGNLEEARRVDAIMKNLEAQMKLNDAAQRYADLLQVLSDQTVTSEEVAVLAQKWGVTAGQVLEYIARIYSANSTEINDGAVINLLMKWGLTKEEAQKYVDFTRALKDEKIDDKEIEELMGKWGMTRQGVLDYAKTVQDGTALQKALSTSWALPGDEAAQSWRNALAALNNYLAALNKTTTIVTGTVQSSSVITDDEAAGYILGDPGAKAAVEAHAAALAALAESELALAELLAQEAARAAAALGLPELDTTNLNTPSFPNFDIEGSSLGTSFDSSSFGSSSSGTTINVTVEGNVQTESDLAEAIRNQLLRGQVSGSGLFLTQAIV